MPTAQANDIDPRIRQQLDDVGRAITTLKSERDALALDREQDRRQLAASDARNKYLEEVVAVVTRQRDFYMGSVIEITTHAGEIEHHYSRLRAATKAVIEMQKTKLPTEPTEPVHDAQAHDSMQQQEPAAPPVVTRDEQGKSVTYRPTVRPPQPAEAFAPPAIRKIAGLER